MYLVKGGTTRAKPQGRLAEEPKAKQGFCAFAGTDDCTIARFVLFEKNFYLLQPTETILLLFA